VNQPYAVSEPTCSSDRPVAAIDTVRSTASRRLFIDNLRWTMILLVVGMHAAVTYSPFGNWYYRDGAATDRLSALAFGTFQAFLQAFFMSLLFAVSGYFACASLLRKGPASFLRDRAIRLGVPVLLYMLAIGPATECFVARSWRMPPSSSFGREWFRHIVDGRVLGESGPLWFCVALLIFSAVYAVLQGVTPPAGHRTTGEGEGDPTLAAMLAFVLAMAAGTFAIRLIVPSGKAVFNLQLGDFPQYVLMFAAGVHARRTGWLDRLSASSGRRWATGGVLLGGLAWVLIIGLGGALQGKTQAYGGGWTWQAAAKALWESWVCVSFSLRLFTLYRARFDTQGRLTRWLSANAFAVYVFHPPILIAVTRLLHVWSMPSLVKFATAWVLGGAASLIFAALVARRTPVLRAFL